MEKTKVRALSSAAFLGNEHIELAEKFSTIVAKFDAKITSREKALAALQRAGILTPTGKFTKHYS